MIASQWGTVIPSTTNNQTSATFPISFTTACYSAVVTGNAYNDSYNIAAQSISKTTIIIGHGNNEEYISSSKIYWIALGK